MSDLRDTTRSTGSSVLVPGLTLCAVCRARPAELTAEPGERWEQPLCFDCVEDLIERENAVWLDRVNGTDTVALLHRAKNDVPRRLPVPPFDWETADHTRLLELRAQWRAYQGRIGRPGTLAGAPRCWAIVPGSSGEGERSSEKLVATPLPKRCVRAEHEAGLCETHLYTGCRVPGLGWQGDEPRGPIVARRARREVIQT